LSSPEGLWCRLTKMSLRFHLASAWAFHAAISAAVGAADPCAVFSRIVCDSVIRLLVRSIAQLTFHPQVADPPPGLTVQVSVRAKLPLVTLAHAVALMNSATATPTARASTNCVFMCPLLLTPAPPCPQPTRRERRRGRQVSRLPGNRHPATATHLARTKRGVHPSRTAAAALAAGARRRRRIASSVSGSRWLGGGRK